MDRNAFSCKKNRPSVGSLSARRAWIEITLSLAVFTRATVALRKESVDRNLVGGINRAVNIVALRKESVDRNTNLVLNA